MRMKVSMAMTMIMAMCSTMFQFMTMAMISMAMHLIQSTVEEGMTVSMARAVRMSMTSMLENKYSYEVYHKPKN